MNKKNTLKGKNAITPKKPKYILRKRVEKTVHKDEREK